MAPELFENSPASFASDVWSFGITVLELLTGNPPYFDKKPVQAVFEIIDNPMPPMPSGLPEVYNSIFRSFISISFSNLHCWWFSNNNCWVCTNQKYLFIINDDKDLVDFLTGCFKRNPQDRPTVKELMNHPWILRNNNDTKVIFNYLVSLRTLLPTTSTPIIILTMII